MEEEKDDQEQEQSQIPREESSPEVPEGPVYSTKIKLEGPAFETLQIYKVMVKSPSQDENTLVAKKKSKKEKPPKTFPRQANYADPSKSKIQYKNSIKDYNFGVSFGRFQAPPVFMWLEQQRRSSFHDHQSPPHRHKESPPRLNTGKRDTWAQMVNKKRSWDEAHPPAPAKQTPPKRRFSNNGPGSAGSYPYQQSFASPIHNSSSFTPVNQFSSGPGDKRPLLPQSNNIFNEIISYPLRNQPAFIDPLNTTGNLSLDDLQIQEIPQPKVTIPDTTKLSNFFFVSKLNLK